MKAILFPFFYFLLITTLFTSCDPNALDNSSNYWNSNSLLRQHLNGNAKSITYNNGSQTDFFNQSGYIVQSVYTTTSGSSTTTYNYGIKGELDSTKFISTIGTGTSYSTTYAYLNTGKFVVSNPFHLLMDGLVPELSSVSNKWGNTAYSFSANKLTLINTSFSDGKTYKDTATAIYDEQYPSTIVHGNTTLKDFKYALNGMFRSYTEISQSVGYTNENKYYFKSGLKFLLLDSIVNTSTTLSVSKRSVIKYVYDSNYNVLQEESYGTIYVYTYEYDSQNNWISKTSKYRTSSSVSWSTPITDYRTIIYW